MSDDDQILKNLQLELQNTRCSNKTLPTIACQGNDKLVQTFLGDNVRIQSTGPTAKKTQLYFASFWGLKDSVKQLLEAGTNPNIQNEETLWTPLHAATFQEHGPLLQSLCTAAEIFLFKKEIRAHMVTHRSAMKMVLSINLLGKIEYLRFCPEYYVVDSITMASTNRVVIMLLLEYGAQPELGDSEQRTSADFASASEKIWPFFAALGIARTTRTVLVEKGILRSGSGTLQSKETGFGIDMADYNSSNFGDGQGNSYMAAMSGDVLAEEQEHRDTTDSRYSTIPQFSVWK